MLRSGEFGYGACELHLRDRAAPRVSLDAEEIQLNDPQTLYRRWEDSQWSPFTIDLTIDTGQWQAMSGADRELISSCSPP